MGEHPDTDVVVVGGGPAGRALAAECGARGLATVLLDRSPDAAWHATYGSWTPELPPDLPASCVAARARGHAIARTRHDLDREYTVLDVAGLRAHLDARLAAHGVEVRTARVVRLRGPGEVVVAGGATVAARWVIDAGGHRQPLAQHGARARPVGAEQTAYGVLVTESAAAPLVAPGTALFMDWRPDWRTGPDDAGASPSFLYGVPVGDGEVLLEETSLARRPGLPLRVLRERLRARLAHHGVAPEPECDVERVRFPLDVPRHRTCGVVGFGSAAPFVHPASGFSVAVALSAAPRVAAALVAGGVRAARREVWSARAAAVHRVRRIGLEALLRMPPERVPDFFEVFLALPDRHRWAYLDGHDDLAGTAATMAMLFRRADWSLRGRLVGPAVRRPAPPSPDDTAPIG